MTTTKVSRWVYFDTANKRWPPKLPGVYVIFFNGQVFYVGSSGTSVFARCRSHYKCLRWKDVDKSKLFIKWRGSDRFGDWAMRELRLIRKLRPLRNDKHVAGK